MKAYICCTKEKFHGKNLYIPDEFDCFPDDESSKPYFAKEPIIEENDRLANGSIVAECDVNEAFFLKGFDGVKYAENPLMHEHETLGHHHCLTEDEIASYGQGKTLYCYHLENVEPIELHLSDFYEDEACTKPLTKAPQSYWFAYLKATREVYREQVDEQGNIVGEGCMEPAEISERVLIFSIHSEYCAKILNGEKDLEVRKTRIAKGVEYK